MAVSIAEMVRMKYGSSPDPLAGVPDEHRDEAKRTVDLWSVISRREMRLLAGSSRNGNLPQWKRDVLARIIAKIVLDADGRLLDAALAALGALDSDFSRAAA